MIENYKLEKLDDDNIKKFLKMNNLNGDNYFHAVIQWERYNNLFKTNVMLYSNIGGFINSAHIIYFDDKNVYLFEMDFMDDRKVVQCISFKKDEFVYVKVKDSFLGLMKKITFKFKSKGRIVFYANKKMKNIKQQMKSINELEKWIN